jgi:hypothetical protein
MSGASKSTTTAAPWDIQIDPLKAGFAQAGHLLDKSKKAKYYGGKTLAGFSAPELSAQHGIMQTAKGAGAKKLVTDAQSQLAKTYGLSNRLAGQATRIGTRAVSDAQTRANKLGAYGQGAMNYGQGAMQRGMTQGQYAGMTPFQEQQMSDMLAGKVNTSATSGLKSVTGAMRRDIMDELQGPSGMLAQIRQQQVGYQPGGGSRGDIVTGMAAKGASQKLADQASRMYADAFSKAQERRLPAGQMALDAQLAAQQLGMQGGQLGLGAGGLAQQGYGTGLQGVGAAGQAGQLGLGAVDRMPGVQNAMYDRFGRMQGVGAQQRAMTQEGYNQKMAKYNWEQNKDQQALQNYMANISGQYGGSTTSNPSALSSMGQLAALFQGFKSDIRAKENIVPEATHWKGFNVYTFNYIGDDIPRRGVMAQEVERTRPDAVYEIDGVKHVAYGIL